MGRKKLMIYDFKRAYDSCDNPEKDKITDSAITQINALPKIGGN